MLLRRVSRKFLIFGCFALAIFGMSCERFQHGRPNSPTEIAATAAPTPQQIESVHLGFGNPTAASLLDQDNFLVVGEGSVISYNNGRGTANWISWKTDRAYLGNSIPRPDFSPDTRLPDAFRRIQYFDYSGSGFDRGHLVPSADRFANKRLNEETFLMTNIVPQTPALNRGPWEKFESYARRQARRGSDVYQIAGVYGELRTLRNKVTVPTNCWKVIAIVPRGKKIEDLDRRMRIIAVDMPNSFEIEEHPWERYKTTIRTIEERTGLDLLSHLSREAQDRLETRLEIQSNVP
jgi:endonuclease G